MSFSATEGPLSPCEAIATGAPVGGDESFTDVHGFVGTFEEAVAAGVVEMPPESIFPKTLA